MIERYHFGAVVIDGVEYRDDVLLLPDESLPSGTRVLAWWREEGHLLQLGDLGGVLGHEPQVLLVGCGSRECLQIAGEVSSHAQRQGIELLAFDTRTACGLFNDLTSRRRVIAALHLAC